MALNFDLPYTDERVARQLKLEELIKAFKPDPYEAAELLACVVKCFRDEEVDVYLTSLCKSLDRYESRNAHPADDGDAQDEAYSLHRARSG